MENRLITVEALNAGVLERSSPASLVRRSWFPLLAFFVSQVLLACLLWVSPGLSTWHAVLIGGMSVWAILRWNTVGIISLAAYAAGCDVLWRMRSADAPWELSKYIVVFL